MLLKDKVCIVTGASKGLGRTIALAFAAEGADIVINGRNEKDLDSLALEITNGSSNVFIAKCDVRNFDDIDANVHNVIEKFGKIDVLLNNAGGAMYTNRKFLEVTEEEWDKVVDTNLKGAFLWCKAVVPHMIQQGGDQRQL